MAMSDEERRAKNAAKQRAYRQRRAAERDAVRAAAVGDVGNGPAPSTMRDAVASALSHMKWLVPSDDASVAQARMLAEDIDLLRHAGESTKAMSAHAKLSRVLNDLGGTPSVRLARELRSSKLMPEVGGSDADAAAEGKRPGNVSKFERPAKRKA